MLDVVVDETRICQWLSELATDYYQCQQCQGLHITRMQQSSHVYDAKIELIDDIISYRIMVEIRPSALVSLIAELSLINAASLVLKMFLDIQDEGDPKLVICHSLSCGEGLTRKQFALFMQQVEEEGLQVISELKQCDLLSTNQNTATPQPSPLNTYH